MDHSDKKFSLSARLLSFRYAFSGIRLFLAKEHNAFLHLAATLVVVVLSWTTKVSSLEAIALAFAIGFVWVTEMFNSCIEKIMDFISEDPHPSIRFIKDLSAAAVLISAFIALVTGFIIFIPKLI